MPKVCLFVLIALIFMDCGNEKLPKDSPFLFQSIPSVETGITFNNQLTEGLNTNVLMYEYFYNGGGVATGDVNGDGLHDIYFTANMEDNKLYLNKGNFQFEDITIASGVGGRPGPWKTGTTMVDINGDNRLDIFVCYSGKVPGQKRIPQLFINQGNDASGKPVFRDEASAYGLADSAWRTQVYFFDYDRDGDLDLLQLNHNPKRINNIDDARIKTLVVTRDKQIGTRLLKNENNHFTDITQESGIADHVLTYNLGAGIADVNSDGWPDIYISNDYLSPDYLYINNQRGGFTNQINDQILHTSQFSMGNDIADINNDGSPDIITLDMLPEDNHRQKLLFAPDNYEEFKLIERAGFGRQYMRNMLQLNNGNGSFSEIGQLAGISNTDWSWAPLLADFDNDGYKDLFVTNGYTRDYTNMDFLKFMSDRLAAKRTGVYRQDLYELVQKIPSSNVINYVFKNKDGQRFENVRQQWGITAISNSTGAAYADLDNDGDLDLVVNNINQEAFIYKNQVRENGNNHYLKIKLQGYPGNTQGIGAKIKMYRNGIMQTLEQMPGRGFQSSVSPLLHFGLGVEMIVDSIKVTWPTGKVQTLHHIKADTLLTIFEKDAGTVNTGDHPINPFFSQSPVPFAYSHAENSINDFKRQPLMVNPQSFNGPCIRKADINGDGLEDIFVGGAAGHPAIIYTQAPGGKFIVKPQTAFEQDKTCEDADAAFFDANEDGYIDIYIASGGYHHYLPNDTALQDRLYLNDGNGGFIRNKKALPQMLVSTGCVRPQDIDGDGDIDLFVGGRVIPGRYPESPESFILINDGKGNYANKTDDIAPSLKNIGMVTDAAWSDIDGDKISDLIVAGEWMPLSIYINKNRRLINETSRYFDSPLTGWWNCLLVDDFNGDGKVDIVAGNAGTNTQCRVSEQQPASIFYKDFDNNGAIDPIFCFYVQNRSYPSVSRDELLDQMAMMRVRFTDYKSYADATINDIFTMEEMAGVKQASANCLETVFLERAANGKYVKKTLPLQAQYAPVFTITSVDFDKDGAKDLLLCGNTNQARLRFGSSDANYGILMRNNGSGGFSYISQFQSGFRLRGDVRSVVNINNIFIFGINQKPAVAYRFN